MKLSVNTIVIIDAKHNLYAEAVIGDQKTIEILSPNHDFELGSKYPLKKNTIYTNGYFDKNDVLKFTRKFEDPALIIISTPKGKCLKNIEATPKDSNLDILPESKGDEPQLRYLFFVKGGFLQ